MNPLVFAADERRLHQWELGLIGVAAFAPIPPAAMALLAVLAFARHHGVGVVAALGTPPLMALGGDALVVWGGWAARFPPQALGPAVVSALVVASALHAAEDGGCKPDRRFGGSATALACLASLAGTLGLLRGADSLLAGSRGARAAAILIFPAVAILACAASSRATRPFRAALREAIFVMLAVALVARPGQETTALAAGAFVVRTWESAWFGSYGVFVLAATAVLCMAGLGVAPAAMWVALALALGVCSGPIRSVVHPGFGARMRLLRRVLARLSGPGGAQMNRVGAALAVADGGAFALDWHRPAAQLLVDRVGVLRVAPEIPAVDLVAALVAAPGEVLAADDVHPYLLGAIDVQAVQRSLAVRGACAAALLREDESREICGVLYLLSGPRARLDAEEARSFRELADAVSASIGAGTEPAIAARLHGA